MKALDKNVILDRFGHSTFDKGREYYEENRVLTAFINGDVLKGKVLGTEVYHTSVSLSDLSNECSCPLGGECKHVVALLLFYLNNKDEVTDLAELKSKLTKKSKDDLIDIIIKAMEGEEILPLIGQDEKDVKIGSFIKVFERGNVDEKTVKNMANTIKKSKNNISKEDLFRLLEKIVLECEHFGCFYDDYRDDYYDAPIFEAIGEALAEKDLSHEDIERLGKIIREDQHQLTEPLIDALLDRAKQDKEFFRSIKKILPAGYIVYFLIENKMYDEAKEILKERDLNPSMRIDLLKLVDPEEALKVAEENKKYTSIIQHYIETKDYDKAKAYIRRAIDENLKDQVQEIALTYKNLISQDRELSNKIVKYLLKEGSLWSAYSFYGNIDEDLKDLFVEKVLEPSFGIYRQEFLDVICERKPEILKDILLEIVEVKIAAGAKAYDGVVQLLEKVKKCMNKEDFNKILDQLEREHYTKYKLIGKISTLRQ
ncbi:SWIM zinc finger family protein [Metallosphaera hakonensis]|uniref:SWIM-type domain-containing protein n=1 Tax=Metallosphaera hakonensis JCM 8857 = DSM 7519 TaxID=1293036 RepID=A0A2U9IRB8_9CREN|nr:SWIM zinc finger family protein [Metallosphaera hakonensis]AWR98524.1 hypothetical protein DFR87_01045 [Metallosphaera hakonensis JCM 8857 = DSM 7519]